MLCGFRLGGCLLLGRIRIGFGSGGGWEQAWVVGDEDTYEVVGVF